MSATVLGRACHVLFLCFCSSWIHFFQSSALLVSSFGEFIDVSVCNSFDECTVCFVVSEMTGVFVSQILLAVHPVIQAPALYIKKSTIHAA